MIEEIWLEVAAIVSDAMLVWLMRLNTMGDRAFLVAATRWWNELSGNVSDLFPLSHEIIFVQLILLRTSFVLI
jgi:hypothetical protein